MVAVGIYKIKKIKAPTKTIESAKAIPAALRGRRSLALPAGRHPQENADHDRGTAGNRDPQQPLSQRVGRPIGQQLLQRPGKS